jgi:hypothetical protein
MRLGNVLNHVNTFRIVNPNGQLKANSPVIRVKVAKTNDFPNVNE